MKLRLAVVLLTIFCLSACSQYTCPTYTKKEVKKEVASETTEKERV